jgi:hypothetical protein
VESGQHERRLREMDAVLSTVVLTQAAGESWICAGRVQRWIDSPVLICGDGTRALGKSMEDSRRTLSNWRSYLVDGDDACAEATSRRGSRQTTRQEFVVGAMTRRVSAISCGPGASTAFRYEFWGHSYAMAHVPALHEQDLTAYRGVFLSNGIDAFFWTRQGRRTVIAEPHDAMTQPHGGNTPPTDASHPAT